MDAIVAVFQEVTGEMVASADAKSVKRLKLVIEGYGCLIEINRYLG